MDKKEKIEYEIEKTLGLFDQKESLPVNPYFYTRVQQRINEKSQKRSLFLGFLKPALMLGLFLLNIGTFAWYFNSTTTYTQVDSQEGLVEILTNDLDLEKLETSIFNIE